MESINFASSDADYAVLRRLFGAYQRSVEVRVARRCRLKQRTCLSAL